MQSTTAFEPDRPLGSPPENVQFTIFPLRDDGASAWIIVGLSFSAAMGAGVISQSYVVAVLALAAFAVVLWRMWIPVQVELGPKGIVEVVLGRRRRISWTAIRRGEIRRRGVLLLPMAEPTPLSTLRGLFLRWGNQRDEVSAVVRYYLGSRVVV